MASVAILYVDGSSFPHVVLQLHLCAIKSRSGIGVSKAVYHLLASAQREHDKNANVVVSSMCMYNPEENC